MTLVLLFNQEEEVTYIGYTWSYGENKPTSTEVSWSYGESIIYYESTGIDTYTKAYTIDSILQKTGLSKSYSIDSLLLKIIAEKFGIDAELLKILTKEYGVDASLFKTLTNDYAVDIALLKSITTDYSIDSILLKLLSYDYSIDSIILNELMREYGIDITLLNRITKEYGIDVAVKSLNETKSYAVDVYLLLSGVYLKSFYIDLLVKRRGITENFVVDTNILKLLSTDYTIDSILLKSLDHDYSMDGNILKTINQDFGIDTYLSHTLYTKQFIIDSLMKQTGLTSSYTLDVIFKIPTQGKVITFKNRSGVVLHNCSFTYLIGITITNIESRSYTFRCLNKSDCDSFESLRSYSNPYFAKQNFLRGAKLVADNSSNQTNSIEIELSGNSSVYSGKGVIYEISPEINAGYKINDRIYTVSLYWIGNDWGTELRKGLYRVDL